jgi:hypothetical protein
MNIIIANPSEAFGHGQTAAMTASLVVEFPLKSVIGQSVFVLDGARYHVAHPAT